LCHYLPTPKGVEFKSDNEEAGERSDWGKKLLRTGYTNSKAFGVFESFTFSTSLNRIKGICIQI